MNKNNYKTIQKQGIALILALSALTLLVMIATAFILSTSEELPQAINFSNSLQAQMLAQSGIFHATEHLQNDILEGTHVSGSPQTTKFPIQIKLNGVATEINGTNVYSRYGTNSDVYTFNTTDESGKIFINEGLGNPADTENLRFVLNHLGDQLSIEKLGDIIIAHRGSGYQSLSALQEHLTHKEYNTLKAFLTCHAWVNHRATNPVPLSPETASSYPVAFGRPRIGSNTTAPPSYTRTHKTHIYRYGRGRNRFGTHNTDPQMFADTAQDITHAYVYGMDELNPQYIEITSRAPVHINSASREVLISLLIGLQGFFLMETPHNIPNNGYKWFRERHTLGQTSGTRTSQDQQGNIGILYLTQAISFQEAEHIADAIITNRTRRLGTSDIYEPWHGPFRSWAQFNAFIDHLVDMRILEDKTGRFNTRSMQHTIASRAIGDTLKANFNPNLHLNEINPNNNLFTLVDKTDLVYRTTEFTLFPTGIYSIESTGRVLIPLDGTDSLTENDNRIAAEKTITTIIKCYDMYRESTQHDFYAGEFRLEHVTSKRPSISAYTGTSTNTNDAIETGPEPDNGRAPMDNMYEGYIQLATIGGPFPIPPGSASPVAGQKHKPKGHVWETPRGGRAYGSTCHGHFTFDFDLHYAVAASRSAEDVRRKCLTRNYNRNQPISRHPTYGGYQTFYNYPDWSETLAGPYTYSETPRASQYGPVPPNTRAYQIAVSDPPTSFKAPSDLRVDGAYIERHAAPVYWSGNHRAPLSTRHPESNFLFQTGVATYWIKPSFIPALAGKVRTFLTASRSWQRLDPRERAVGARPEHLLNPSPFGHFFLPLNNARENRSVRYAWGRQKRFMNMAQRSFLFGMSYSNRSDALTYGGAHLTGGVSTKSLNHIGHRDSRTRSLLRSHEWTHVTLTWDQRPDEYHRTASGWTACKRNEESLVNILVNGHPVNSSWAYARAQPGHHYIMTPKQTAQWNRDRWNYITPLAIGEPSVQNDSIKANNQNRTHNFTADSTVDELYVWNNLTQGLPYARTLWKQGRYFRGYLDASGIPHYAEFRSSSIPVPTVKGHERTLPPASVQRNSITFDNSTNSPSRIIGVTWTWVAEENTFGTTSHPFTHTLYDYKPTDTDPRARPRTLYPKLKVRISTDQGNHWSVSQTGSASVEDNGWNPIRDPQAQGDALPLNTKRLMMYSVVFDSRSDPLNAILLTSPVLDDITIYYQNAKPLILEWTVS